MAKRKYSPEKIINKLRAIELSIAQGDTVEQSCRQAAINVQTYYRWRSRYDGNDDCRGQGEPSACARRTRA